MSTPATRRTVLRAAAWTVPAVTVVAAAPAHAASGAGLTLTWVPNSADGNSITATLHNPTAYAETVVLSTPLEPAPRIYFYYWSGDQGRWTTSVGNDDHVAQTVVDAGATVTFGVTWWVGPPIDAVGPTGTAYLTLTGSLSPTVVVGVPLPIPYTPL